MTALCAMHARCIAHCDIKSENLLLDAKFNLKIVDFGYARLCRDPNSFPIYYHASDPVGSLKSNAPELAAQG